MKPISIRLALLIAAILLVPACGGSSGGGGAPPAPALPASGTILVVTDTNSLVNVSASAPSVTLTAIGLTGLQPGEVLYAIDYRPADGQLYGLGSTSRLYRIQPNTGASVQVGVAGAFTLNGTVFGFDVNPTVDRIRVVSDADQNLRLNPNDGTLTAIDTLLNPGNPNVAASAYSNNFSGAATTTLYGIDTNIDALVIQNPPNSGVLTTVGPLGVDTTGSVHFDISATGTAYAAMRVGGVTQLYTINVATGAATLVGTLGSGGVINGMTIVP
jgi:Domain of unknown function (DUF4394)